MSARNFFVLIALALTFVGVVSAQSTIPSNPTPVNGEYVGKGPGKETNYFFSFTAGPGDVSVGLEIKPKNYSTFARIEIGNNPSNLIAMHNMNASTATGTSSVVKSFKLDTMQSVKIRLTLDGNLAEYKLSVSGAGISAENSGSTSDSAGAGNSASVGKLGKLTGGGSKIGTIVSSKSKPKVGLQSSNGDGGNAKLSFTCPKEVMYKIVENGDWNPTLYSQKRYLFESAAVDGPRLSCTYKSLTGADDSATLVKNAPTGYSCTVYNGGPKSKDFNCTLSITAALIRRMDASAAKAMK